MPFSFRSLAPSPFSFCRSESVFFFFFFFFSMLEPCVASCDLVRTGRRSPLPSKIHPWSSFSSSSLVHTQLRSDESSLSVLTFFLPRGRRDGSVMWLP